MAPSDGVDALPPLLSGAAAPLLLALMAAVGLTLVAVGLAMLRRPGLVAARLGTAQPTPRSLQELELQLSFRERVLRPLVRACAGLVVRYTPASAVDGYRRKLVLAGSPMEVRDFLGVKGLLAIGAPLAYLLASGLAGQPSPLTALALAALGFVLPNVVVDRRIKRRQAAIQRALPDALDLLMISVEAGLGFDGAMARVVEKRHDELSQELGRVLAEMRIGRARRDALRLLVQRTGVPDVSAFVSAIVQSEQLGVSIARVLSTQAEQIRLRRRQRAEQLAHKAAIKLLFPMVFLIFPAIFVVVLGPAIPGIVQSLASTQ